MMGSWRGSRVRTQLLIGEISRSMRLGWLSELRLMAGIAYMYAAGNPILYKDPTGHCAGICIRSCCCCNYGGSPRRSK